MVKTNLFYHPIFLEHQTGYGHPESPERIPAIFNLLKQKEPEIDKIVIQPRQASEEEISLVHTPSYIEKVKAVSERGGGYLDMDTHLSQKSYEAALFAAGAALSALERVFSGQADNAFCVVRPPGHHALEDQGMGFCLFDNLAIGARFAQKNMGVKKILIIDWDVHHGNGLSDTFYDDPTVLYISLHQYPHYPGTGWVTEIGTGEGVGYNINFPFPAGTSGPSYHRAFDEVIVPLAQAYKPDLLMIAAGFDAHYYDPISSINLTAEDYASMTEKIKKISDNLCLGRIIASLEGGYGLSSLAKSAWATIDRMMGKNSEIDEIKEFSPSPSESDIIIERVKSTLSSYWKL